MYVSQMGATALCALSGFDVSFIMPPGAFGSGTAASNILLVDQLGLSRRAIVRLLGAGVVASSGQEDATCSGRLAAIQTAFECKAVDCWANMNTSFNMMAQPSACDTIVAAPSANQTSPSGLKSSRSGPARSTRALEPPRSALPFHIARRFPRFFTCAHSSKSGKTPCVWRVWSILMPVNGLVTAVPSAPTAAVVVLVMEAAGPGRGAPPPKHPTSEDPCYDFQDYDHCRR